ncbi:alpha/beta fold hydrolase [Metabacillus litoralis]|uniref:Alpha/beta fold hydrolase n=1 Tax=Metabacillus litoralis TaxID=152268 RepID=A0A5C6V8Z4_9BACI|nr:alpha/beta fold hydrolase [Metabacillus litoralis]
MNSYPVIKGAESIYFSGNKTGILLCHGFNGTPQSMQYIGEQLSQYGYTVSIPRLSGHGTHYKEMESSTYETWIMDLEAAYEHLKTNCSNVYIVGQSMGGALTLQLAAKKQHIDGIFLINAAVTEVAYESLKDEESPRFIHEGTPDIKKPSVFEITYDKVPLKAIHQLLFLMEDTKQKIKLVSCPTFIFKSAIDHVVSPRNSDFILHSVSSDIKKQTVLEHSYHVASMDYDAQLIVGTIHKDINNLQSSKSVKTGKKSSVESIKVDN